MAAGSLLTLLDDIATVLDDVAVMTKVATKKTASVLGDDLALNAEQVSGVRAERELPVVWAVAKGSARNKAILVPAALAISAFIPALIMPLLMIGGAYLCFEGVEKVLHKLLHGKDEETAHHREMVNAVSDPEIDMAAFEKEKINGAIRTDFVLSAEIIVITLGAVAEKSLITQTFVVVIISVLMTIGVYGLVAGIVKLDDAGLHLMKTSGITAWSGFKRNFGRLILRFAPYLMKGLSIVGTAAMFIVGGGIIVHGIPGSHELIQQAQAVLQGIAGIGSVLAVITPIVISIMTGFIIGGIVLTSIRIGRKLLPKNA